jgi:hypothetical protein
MTESSGGVTIKQFKCFRVPAAHAEAK